MLSSLLARLNEHPPESCGWGAIIGLIDKGDHEDRVRVGHAQGHAAFWAQGLLEQGLRETARTHHSAQHTQHMLSARHMPASYFLPLLMTTTSGRACAPLELDDVFICLVKNARRHRRAWVLFSNYL